MGNNLLESWGMLFMPKIGRIKAINMGLGYWSVDPRGKQTKGD